MVRFTCHLPNATINNLAANVAAKKKRTNEWTN